MGLPGALRRDYTLEVSNREPIKLSRMTPRFGEGYLGMVMEEGRKVKRDAGGETGRGAERDPKMSGS